MSLEKYSVEKLIGKGSYGEVFLAKHKKDKRMYVVKKVSLKKASERERKAAELEAQLLSQLRHPNIVSYRESFQGSQGVLYIVMNYCEGGDLYTKLKAQKSTLLGEDQIVQWFVQIAMALQYMHEKHILHRDLKTQNIFLTRSKIIKLGDLGIARVLENSYDMATTLIGTPYYMSPELFSNKPYNHKSDVWALGCCLYEMCTLQHAFNAKDMSSLVYKILKGKTPPLPKQYSSDLCSIISSMLDQNPCKRPSVSRLLRNPYIKKQIAKFLEGTKNRQNRKKSGSESKIVQSPTKPSLSSKSDSGFVDPNLQSIVTVSGVDCIIEDAPRKVRSSSANDPQTPVERSHSENDVGQVSVDSSQSSSSSNSTLEKGPREVNEPVGNGVEAAEREIVKKIVKRHVVPKPRRSLVDNKGTVFDERSSAADEKIGKFDENTPVKRVHSAGSSRPQPNEPKPSVPSRPLPRPPPPQPRPSVGEAPMSKSPRARRRYKISTKVPSHEGEEEDDDKSAASVESDKSSHSVSESSNVSGLSARERRRLKLRASGSPLPSPSVSYNTPPLPSPKGVIADLQRKKSQDHGKKAVDIQNSRETNKKPLGTDCVDGSPRKPQRKMDSYSDDSGSDLEEVSSAADELSSGASRSCQSEVSSLISALDSTLKLDDLSVDRVSPELEDEPMEKAEILIPSGASPTVSGRLRDRIERLKLECLHGIGEEMLHRAYNIIDSSNEDAVEDELVKIMGRENFDKFGGPIWQLKFCESFRIS